VLEILHAPGVALDDRHGAGNSALRLGVREL
jgi:hypothetical protein